MHVTTKTAKKYLDKNLRFQFKVLFVISIIIFCIMSYNVLVHKISLQATVLAEIIGALVGYVAARLIKVMWHPSRNTIVAQIDFIGLIAIAGYIVFEMYNKYLFDYWLKGETLAAFTLAIVFGMMIGRVIGLAESIYELLRKG